MVDFYQSLWTAVTIDFLHKLEAFSVVLGDKYFEDFGDIFVTFGDQDMTVICTEIS